MSQLSPRPSGRERVYLSRNRGFTLVELLIVVGIIALLVTMVVFSLGRIQELARKAQCKAQLHAYGVAVGSYVGT